MADRRGGLGRLATAALLVLLGATGARAQENVGSVAALEGSAEVTHPGQTARVPLHAADAVLLDDALHTGVASKMKLLFRDDAVLTLAADSELTVTREIVGPASATATHDVIGTVRAVVTDRYKTPGSSFEVETPTAIAGVRGTGFIVRYEATKKLTTVVDLYGVVCVRPRGDHAPRAEVCLKTKQFTEVRAGKAPTAAATVDPRLLQALFDATELLGGGLEPDQEIGPEGGLKPGQRPPAQPGTVTGQALDEPIQPAGQVLPREGGVVDQPIPEIQKEIDRRTTLDNSPPPPPPPAARFPTGATPAPPDVPAPRTPTPNGPPVSGIPGLPADGATPNAPKPNAGPPTGQPPAGVPGNGPSAAGGPKSH